jgi:hypothetical protein
MVKFNLLTYLTFELNRLLDGGRNMPMEEARKLCEEKRIFEALESKFPFKETGLDLSLLLPEKRKELTEVFYDMAIATSGPDFGLTKNGLCLLIAFAQEQIQRQAREAGL